MQNSQEPKIRPVRSRELLVEQDDNIPWPNENMSNSRSRIGESTRSHHKRIFKFPEFQEYYADLRPLKLDSRDNIDKTNSFFEFMQGRDKDQGSGQNNGNMMNGMNQNFPHLQPVPHATQNPGNSVRYHSLQVRGNNIPGYLLNNQAGHLLNTHNHSFRPQTQQTAGETITQNPRKSGNLSRSADVRTINSANNIDISSTVINLDRTNPSDMLLKRNSHNIQRPLQVNSKQEIQSKASDEKLQSNPTQKIIFGKSNALWMAMAIASAILLIGILFQF